jgi:hypothetical protein
VHQTAAALLALAVAGGALLGGCPGGPKPPAGPPAPKGVGPDAEPLELALETIDAVPAKLSALRGRITVVTFFTTGSEDALILTDLMKAIHAGWTPYGVKVVGIALDKTREIVSVYAEGAALPYPVLLGSEDVREGRTPLGPVWAIPLTLVLDKAGRVRFHHYGLVKLEVLEAEFDALRSER